MGKAENINKERKGGASKGFSAKGEEKTKGGR